MPGPEIIPLGCARAGVLFYKGVWGMSAAEIAEHEEHVQGCECCRKRYMGADPMQIVPRACLQARDLWFLHYYRKTSGSMGPRNRVSVPRMFRAVVEYLGMALLRGAQVPSRFKMAIGPTVFRQHVRGCNRCYDTLVALQLSDHLEETKKGRPGQAADSR